MMQALIESFDVPSTPAPNIFDEWQKRQAVISQGVHDVRGYWSVWLSVYDLVADQFVQLLREDLLRDARHDSANGTKMFR